MYAIYDAKTPAPVFLLHGVVACDSECAALDNNLLQLQCIRVCVQCRAFDYPHAQGNGRVFGQG